MVQLTTIYTKGGDKGKTSLGNGQRLFKNALRFKLIGDIDESNAHIGLAYTYARLEKNNILEKELRAIQHDLFDLGADCCMPDLTQEALRITALHVERLEKNIDQMNQNLTPLKSFILPGGTLTGATLHLARTVVRRAERTMVDCMVQEPLNDQGLVYLNRLSDYLFVLSRFANGTEEVLWQPGATTQLSS